ncbi:MAG: hypothetical protein R3C52_12595 [Hyphomonadaceae bacterium]
MGGVILLGLIALAVVILITPAMRTRGERRRREIEKAAHDAVMRRLERRKALRPLDSDAKEPGKTGDGGTDDRDR